MLEFQWLWVFLLLPLPWLVNRYGKRLDVNRQSSVAVPFIDELVTAGASVSRGLGGERKSVCWWLGLLSWIFLVISAANPYWLGEPVPQEQKGRDIMLAVDLSDSMQAQDFILRGRRLDRLTATQIVAKDFIERRKGDRIGLVLFGTQAYLQTPLTADLKTVQQFLNEAAIGLAGKRTAIGDAIGLTIKHLNTTDNPEKIMVLLTDGTNTAGVLEPLQAAELAKAEGVKIYTIGIGGELQVQQGFMGFFQMNQTPELDEELLRSIAATTGGKYYRARNFEELMDIYNQLDLVEPIAIEGNEYRPITSLYVLPLVCGILLLCLAVVLPAFSLKIGNKS